MSKAPFAGEAGSKTEPLGFFSRLFFLFFACFLKVLKSWDSEPGTPLERSGSKFRFKSRARELRSIYGDPFREDFVPNLASESGPAASKSGPAASKSGPAASKSGPAGAVAPA